MATIIKPKRSETSSSAPTTANLAVGEIAINTADQKIYTRDSGNNIVTLAQPGLLNVVEDTTPQLGGSLDVNGNLITSSADIQLDAETQIKLDANSAGNIWLQDNGTTYGKLYNFNGMKIESSISDNDFQISVNDGGSFINALTIDASEEGDATFNSNIFLGDDKKVNFGADSDLQIYHDGTNSYIDDAGTGTIFYRSGTQTFQNAAGSKTMAVFNAATSVDLSYDNNIKFQTTTDGTLTCGSSTITDGTVSWPFASKSDNLHIGTDASCSLTTGTNNIAVGCQSLKLNEDGANNIAIGQNSLCCATTPSCNIVIGKNSLCASDECTFVGCWNGSSYPTITRSTEKNIVIGNNLITNETMAHNNTIIGHDIATASASYICTWGCTCTCNGLSAIPYDEKTANNNTLIGNCIAPYSSRVDKNVIIGSCINTDTQALASVSNSQIFGYNVLNCSATSGVCCNSYGGKIENSFISGTCLFDGHEVQTLLQNVIIGSEIGSSSCFHQLGPKDPNSEYDCCVQYRDSIILGACASQWAWWNQCSVTIGSSAGLAHSVSDYNTYVGADSGAGSPNSLYTKERNLKGYYNTAIGTGAMGNMGGDCDTNGDDLIICSNTAVGSGTLSYVAGCGNVAIGRSSSMLLRNGDDNTTIGFCSGILLGCSGTAACDNVLIGKSAGSLLVSGSCNIVIGADVEASSNSVSNETTIGGACLRFPGLQSSATDGQVLTYCSTNDNIVFKDAGGMSWAICTSNFTAVAGEGYFIDTSSSTITSTLPASATLGDQIHFKDYNDTFDTNNLTVGRNSHNIEGSATDLPVSTEGAGFTLVYVDNTRGWVHKHKIDEQSFFNDSTITITPGSEGNFDLSFDPDQTTQETPFESGGVDAFGVAVSSYQYSLMDPVNELINVDLGEF